MSNLNIELEILRLNNRLKSTIFQENNITDLFQKLCNNIPKDNIIYDYAWIISKEKNTIYNSNNESEIIESKNYKDCYDKLFSNNGASIIDHNSNKCLLKRDNNKSIIISTPIIHKSITIGAIAISVKLSTKNIVEFHKEILQGLSKEISHQIHLLKTEELLKTEKQELIKSNLNFKTIANLHAGSLFIFDFDLNLVFASLETHNTIKAINNNSLKLNIKDIFKNLTVKHIHEAADLIISGKQENVTINLDLSVNVGYPLIIKTKSSILYNHKKEPENFISIIEDITETSKNESASKEFEYTYSTIFDKAPVGIAILDKDAYIININEEEQNILGYKKEDIIGKHVSQFLTEENKLHFKPFFDKFLKQGSIEAYVDLVNKKGNIIHSRKIAKGVFDSNNKLIRIISHTQDITESHATQKKLHILSQAIDQSPAIIAISDKNNKLTYINKKYTEITGYSPEEAIGKKSSFLKSEFHTKSFYQEISNKINNGEQWQGKFCNKNNKGKIYWEKAEISPFYDSKGEHSGFIKTAEDITKLIAIEAQLAERINTYLHIFESVPTPIIIHKDGLIIDLNSAAVDFANGDKDKLYNKEEYIGKKTSKYTTPAFEIKTKERRRLMQLNGTALPMITEVLYNSKNEARNVEMVSAPVKFNNEPAFMLVFEDITERLNWTKALKESEHKFHSIFDTNPDTMIISRISDGVIIDVNKGFLIESLFDRKDVIGKTALSLGFYNNEEDRNILLETIKHKGKIDDFETILKKKNGSEVFGLISARKIKLNEYDALLFIIRNITQRKEMEQQLINSKIKAEENDRLKTAFLANMSHEIRNPMNAIIGFSDLLKDEDLSKEESNKYIDIIQSKGEDLMVLINDIIDVSKIESGVLEIENSIINLSKLITDIKRNYEINFAKIEGLNFNINLNNNDNCYIKGDNTRLHQIFNNLVDNALKFTTSGEISISLSIDNETAKIEVKDTGIGIPKDKLDTIFDRFTQLETNEIISGAGLGLCISKSLIHIMQGKIKVESKLNIGTNFIINFPILNTYSDNTITNVQEDDINEYVIDNIKISIIEKDPVSRNLYSSIFRKNISNIDFYNNIDELKDTESFDDIIILNIYPNNNNLRKKIAQIKIINPEIKILGVFIDETFIKENYGEDDSIVKPFIKKTLLKKIIHVLK